MQMFLRYIIQDTIIGKTNYAFYLCVKYVFNAQLKCIVYIYKVRTFVVLYVVTSYLLKTCFIGRPIHTCGCFSPKM